MGLHAIKVLGLLTVSTLLAACSGASDVEEQGARSLPTPESAVGELAIGSALCTAFLVDTDVALTTAACVSDQDPTDAELRLDSFGQDDDIDPVKTAKVLSVSVDRTQNLARVKLDTRFDSFLRPGAAESGPARLVAWDHASERSTTSSACAIEVEDFVVSHDCVTEHGSSGGALVQGGRVVAIHVGSMNDQGLALALEPAAESTSGVRPLEHSNRNQVREAIAAGGWQVIWGDLINEADVITGVAAALTGTFSAWVQYQIDAQIDHFTRSAGDVAADAVKQALLQAYKNGEVRVSNKLGVKAGVATYNRWERIVYHVPFCKGLKCKMKEKENRIPLPNNHQPYVAFRLF